MTIRESLRRRLEENRWLPELARTRQRHWLRGLRDQALLYLGASWWGSLLGAFDRLTELGIAAVSRSVCPAKIPALY